MKKRIRRYIEYIKQSFLICGRKIAFFANEVYRHATVLSIAVACSIFLLLLTYWIDSAPYSIGGELTVGQWIERGKMIYRGNNESIPDSIVLVNITYDKALMDYNALLDAGDEDCKLRQYVGKNTVTDRSKLLSFLNKIDSIPYKYILLDIRFEPGFETDSVSARLFHKILSMDNIVIARHANFELADETLFCKTALSDYNTTFWETNFIKYPCIQSSGQTIPGKMYHDLYGRNITRHSLWFSDNGRLCYGSMFLTFPVTVTKWQQRIEDDPEIYTPLYLNLGTDVLMPSFDFDNTFTNKIIVVGDFVEDVHDTYIGSIPGALINLNAFIALINRHHIVNGWWIFILFCIYFMICLALLKHISVFDYIPFIKHSKSKLLRFFLSFVGYSVILSVMAIIYYVTFNRFYSTIFPAFYFACLSAFVRTYYMNTSE